jgi:hypothetical protein
MLWIKSALVPTARIFIQDISKAEAVEKVSWRESHQNLLVARKP